VAISFDIGELQKVRVHTRKSNEAIVINGKVIERWKK
jgi:hypothetical protein